MKRYITSNSDTPLYINEIVSVVFVNDVESYNPRDRYIYSANDINYSELTDSQLSELPPKQLKNIHDINVLRRLDVKDLTLQQRMEVTQYNKNKFLKGTGQINKILQELKNCDTFYIWPFPKNDNFFTEISKLGGSVSNTDAKNIIHSLHVKDYVHSTYSYLDANWNSLLMVFEYQGTYTFAPKNNSDSPVEVDPLNLYIKIDVDTVTDLGYGAMSFHRPEYVLSHPYSDYKADL